MKVHSSSRRMFPGCPATVPMEMLNEDWAKQIHGQTLDRLNERGGMGINEILGNIKRLSYQLISGTETAADVMQLKKLIEEFENKQVAKQILPESEYFRVTNCIGNFRVPEFTFEEVQIFLIKLGYQIVLKKGTVNNGDDYVPGERIFAIKPGKALPEFLDTSEADEMDFRKVFAVEMKKKLLEL